MKTAQRSAQFASNRAILWISRVLVTWHLKNTAKLFQHLLTPGLPTLQRVELIELNVMYAPTCHIICMV